MSDLLLSKQVKDIRVLIYKTTYLYDLIIQSKNVHLLKKIAMENDIELHRIMEDNILGNPILIYDTFTTFIDAKNMYDNVGEIIDL